MNKTINVILPAGVAYPCTSYCPEVVADSSGKFVGNALRFPTYEEALANVEAKMQAWIMVTDTRVVGSNDAPNYRWIDGKLADIQPNLFEQIGEQVSA